MTEHAYDYERGYDPPAPVVPLRVSAPASDATVVVPALVDSGADVSVLPRVLVRQLDLPVTDLVRLSVIGGAARTASVHAAWVELGGVERIVEVVAMGRQTLVGRNLLESLVVTLDGPAQRATLG